MFSDGTPLSAASVKQSIEASLRAGGTLPAAFASIRGAAGCRAGDTVDVAGIIARNDHEIELQLDEALPIYPALLTEGSTAIARPADGDDQPVSRLIGTGPFQLVSQEPHRVVVGRNPKYWRSGLPRLDAIEFRPSLTASTVGRRFRAGEIDLARDLVSDDLEDILRDPRFRQGLVETPKKNTYFVLFNCRKGPVASNLAVRRALSGVVRPRDVVWRTLGRFAAPASGLIPPGMLGHDPGRRWPSLTREEALATLREAGIETPLRLNAAVQPLITDRSAALLTGLFDVWADVGAEVHADTMDMTSFLGLWRDNASIDLLIGRWNADYDDPDNFTHTLFHSGSGGLHAYCSSPESDRLLDEARTESRPAIRETLYRRFEELLLESAALVPLFHDIDYRVASPRVRGLVLRGTKPYVNYAEVGVAAAAEPLVETRRGSGGIVQVPMAGVVVSLDPVQRITAESAEAIPFVIETLTRDQGQGRIVPWLASTIAVEDGGQRYRIRLRDDVTFHDGRRLGARDVRYSLERLLQSHESAGEELFASNPWREGAVPGRERRPPGLPHPLVPGVHHRARRAGGVLPGAALARRRIDSSRRAANPRLVPVRRRGSGRGRSGSPPSSRGDAWSSNAAGPTGGAAFREASGSSCPSAYHPPKSRRGSAKGDSLWPPTCSRPTSRNFGAIRSMPPATGKRRAWSPTTWRSTRGAGRSPIGRSGGGSATPSTCPGSSVRRSGAWRSPPTV